MIANHLSPPQITRETLLARLEGVHALYRQDVCAEYLWGYCATGNVVTPFDRHRFGIILREWDNSQATFRRVYRGKRPTREEVLIRCELMLEDWLRHVSPDVHTNTLAHAGDVVSASRKAVEALS